MGFGKPFKAVPVRLAPEYVAKHQRQPRIGIVKALGAAAVLGAIGGTISALPAGAVSALTATSAGTGPAPQMIAAPVRAAHIFYRNCDDARASGAAPIYMGEPGYRPPLDADGDGVACEPYRR